MTNYITVYILISGGVLIFLGHRIWRAWRDIVACPHGSVNCYPGAGECTQCRADRDAVAGPSI